MELTKYYFYRIKNNFFTSNSYIFAESSSNFCLIIDPGLDFNAIDEKIEELHLQPVAILATHGHFDHIASVSKLKNKYSIPFYLHEKDYKISQSANFYLKIANITQIIETPKPDFLFKHQEETLVIGNFKINIYNYSGHSSGSCVIQCNEYLFTGDIIYKKGLGFNNFPGENKLKLKESILDIFKKFSGSSLILPGHGESDCLNNFINNNIELRNFLNI